MRIPHHSALPMAPPASQPFPAASTPPLAPAPRATTTMVLGKKAESPAEVFANMQRDFKASKAKGQTMRFMFVISGSEGGTWFIEVVNGRLKMGKGSIKNADVTFKASDENWVKIANKEIGGMRAFITRALQIDGSKSDARKLGEFFDD